VTSSAVKEQCCGGEGEIAASQKGKGCKGICMDAPGDHRARGNAIRASRRGVIDHPRVTLIPKGKK